MEEAKRQRVADLLCAHVTYSEITRITGVSSRTISKVKKRLDAGGDLKKAARPSGQSGKAKILTEAFLQDLEAWFEANPTMSICKTAKEMKVDDKTIRNGLKKIARSSRGVLSAPLFAQMPNLPTKRAGGRAGGASGGQGGGGGWEGLCTGGSIEPNRSNLSKD